MSDGDQYRIKAVAFYAQALAQTNPKIKREFEKLAKSYLLLAQQADRNSQLDLVYEPAPPKIDPD
jgi:hypothetical protein